MIGVVVVVVAEGATLVAVVEVVDVDRCYRCCSLCVGGAPTCAKRIPRCAVLACCSGTSATRACWRVGLGPLVKKRVCFHSSINNLEVVILQQLAEQCGAITRVQVSQHVDIVVVADGSNVDITYPGVERVCATAFVARAQQASREYYNFVEEDMSFAGSRKPHRETRKRKKKQDEEEDGDMEDLDEEEDPATGQASPAREHGAGQFTPSQFQAYDSAVAYDASVEQDAVFRQVALELESFLHEHTGSAGVKLSRIYWTSTEQIQELRRCVVRLLLSWCSLRSD